ncbi:MAG: hypothetical protein PHX87_04895 [Candidatus Peribacteraceae bacterium]|nr:hypothetical protein [Candidatus Peribacteraceae bacterium]MDD5742733.1 hypothetical protein [Candidatus Peribacteraceae bacterium]
MDTPDAPKPSVEQSDKSQDKKVDTGIIPSGHLDRASARAKTHQGVENISRGTEAPKVAQIETSIENSQTPSQFSSTPQVVPKTSAEEDLGTGKGAFDKISDGMQKAFEIVQKFMKQIQAMGSSTLRGMASTLSMLGFKKAAEWLNEMAGADFAELMSALKKGNLAPTPVSPDDPEAKAKGEAAERGQAQLADRYKVLAQTRSPAFNREMYYSEVVSEWKKKGGNGGKTAVTHNDLLDMATTAQELPPTLPGQVAQAPEFVQPLESLVTPMNIMSGAPVKVTVKDKTVSLQALPSGEITVAVGESVPVRYHLILNADGFDALQFNLRSAQLSKDGLQLSGEASNIAKVTGTTTNINYPSRLLAMNDIRIFLEAVVQNPSGPLPVGSGFRFERV